MECGFGGRRSSAVRRIRHAGSEQITNAGLTQTPIGVLPDVRQQAVHGAGEGGVSEMAGAATGQPGIDLDGHQDVMDRDLLRGTGEPITALESTVGHEDACIDQGLQDLAHVPVGDASSHGDIPFTAQIARSGDVHHGPYGVLAGQTEHHALRAALAAGR